MTPSDDFKMLIEKEMCRTHREAIQHQLDGYGGCCHKRQGNEE